MKKISFRGPRLKHADFELLFLLSNQRLLTTDQMYTFYSTFQETSIKSFRVKLNRWSKYELIIPHKYLLGQDGFYMNYYRIGHKGVELLIEAGLLTEDWMQNQFRKFSSVRNLDHFLATQEVAITGIIQMKKHGVQINSLSPFENPYLEEDETNKRLVVPDWILNYKDIYLNIELDTGTESPQELRNKIEGYIALCLQNPEQKHTVLIAVMDDSFRTRFSYGDDRTKRIANLKKVLFGIPNLHISNLSVFVLPLSRVPVHIFKLLDGHKPANSRMRTIEINTGLQILNEFNRLFEYKISDIETLQEHYPMGLESSYYADKVVRFSNISGTINETAHIFWLEEGNVQQLDRIHHLSKHLSEHTGVSRKTLGFYSSTDERENDVIGNTYSYFLVGDVEQWMSQIDREPTFYKLISPYRLGAVTFEGKVYS